MSVHVAVVYIETSQREVSRVQEAISRDGLVRVRTVTRLSGNYTHRSYVSTMWHAVPWFRPARRKRAEGRQYDRPQQRPVVSEQCGSAITLCVAGEYDGVVTGNGDVQRVVRGDAV